MTSLDMTSLDMTSTLITDGRDRADLPDVAPGEVFEGVVRSQKFVLLHRIRVVNTLPRGDMVLVRLQIGKVENVPFERESNERHAGEGPVLTYRLRGLDNADLRTALIETGAAVATNDSIAIAPILEVRVTLRNDGLRPAKPRVALIVYEEIT